MKEARDVAVNAAKAQGKLGEDLATAKAKRVGEVIEAGGLPNRQTVNVLNEMEDAMRHAGNNISTGPGAERWLKVKQAANNLWPDLFKGVPETEAVVKLNAQLASAAAKAMTARPSQLEFRAFMANNPGIANSPQGSYALINLLRQAKEQELALSREAMRLKPGNIDQWTDIEDRFYEKHPLISPFTGKPLTGEQGQGGGVASRLRRCRRPRSAPSSAAIAIEAARSMIRDRGKRSDRRIAPDARALGNELGPARAAGATIVRERQRQAVGARLERPPRRGHPGAGRHG